MYTATSGGPLVNCTSSGLNIKTVKADMASCNSSYKIGCVEPEGFQQLIADRFLQKDILKSHPLSAFSSWVRY